MHKRVMAAAIALAVLGPAAVGTGLSEARAQTGPGTGAQATDDAGTFYIADRRIFTVAPTGYYTAEDRILENMRRVIRVVEAEDANEPDLERFDVNRDVQAQKVGDTWVVLFKGIDVATVTPDDIKANQMPAQQIAQMWANNLKAGLASLETPGATLKTALSQMRVAVGGQTVATGISGSTPTMVANRIRRAIDRDPELRNEDVFIDVQPNEVIIRGEVPSRRVEQRIESIVQDESYERAVRSDLRIEGTRP